MVNCSPPLVRPVVKMIRALHRAPHLLLVLQVAFLRVIDQALCLFWDSAETGIFFKLQNTKGISCRMTRTKELPNSTSSPHTPTELPRCTTGKKITRPGTSIPNKRWNMRVKPCSGRKTLIGSPRKQRGSHRAAWSHHGTGYLSVPLELGVQCDGREIMRDRKTFAPKSTKGMTACKEERCDAI